MVQVAVKNGDEYMLLNCNGIEIIEDKPFVHICDVIEINNQSWNDWTGLSIQTSKPLDYYYYNNEYITMDEFITIFNAQLSGVALPEAKVMVAVKENDTCYLRHCNSAQLIDGEVFLNFFFDEVINYDTYCFLGFLHLNKQSRGVHYSYKSRKISAEEFIEIFNKELEESKKSLLYWKQIDTEPKTEAVNHPNHYGGENNPLEVINIIEHYELGFHLGNVVKYVLRAGKKGNRKEDLKKALWYLEREIMKGGENG